MTWTDSKLSRDLLLDARDLLGYPTLRLQDSKVYMCAAVRKAAERAGYGYYTTEETLGHFQALLVEHGCSTNGTLWSAKPGETYWSGLPWSQPEWEGPMPGPAKRDRIRQELRFDFLTLLAEA